MSDLSRLLEDVYRSDPPAPASPAAPDATEAAAPPASPAPSDPERPSWSSDTALDEVFADWVPGPPADAPEAERAYAYNAEESHRDEPEPASDSSFDDDPFAPLQALLEEAMRLAPDIEEPDEEPEVAEAVHDEAVHDEAVVIEATTDLLERFDDVDVTDVDVTSAPIDLEARPQATVFEAMLDRTVGDGFDPVVHVEPLAPAFVAPQPVSGWSRSDDDILPTSRARRSFRLRR